MSMKKINIKILLLSLGVLFLSVLATGKNVQALPFLPKVYVGVGGFAGAGGFDKGTVVGANANGFNIKHSHDDNSGFMLNAGIEPNLPLIPVIGGLRAQVEYDRNFNKQFQGNIYGIGLYYDIFRILPIVHPYIGASWLYYDAKAKVTVHCATCVNNSGSAGVDRTLNSFNVNQPVAAFSFGVNFGAPLLPISGFIEYRYTTSALFSSNIKKDDNEDIGVKGLDFNSHSIILGLRYYIL